MARVREQFVVYLDGLSVDLVRPAGEVPERADRYGDVKFSGAHEDLAVVECLKGGQFVDMLLKEVGELVEVRSTL